MQARRTLGADGSIFRRLRERFAIARHAFIGETEAAAPPAKPTVLGEQGAISHSIGERRERGAPFEMGKGANEPLGGRLHEIVQIAARAREHSHLAIEHVENVAGQLGGRLFRRRMGKGLEGNGVVADGKCHAGMPGKSVSYSTFPDAPFKIDLLDEAGKRAVFTRRFRPDRRFRFTLEIPRCSRRPRHVTLVSCPMAPRGGATLRECARRLPAASGWLRALRPGWRHPRPGALRSTFTALRSRRRSAASFRRARDFCCPALVSKRPGWRSSATSTACGSFGPMPAARPS